VPVLLLSGLNSVPVLLLSGLNSVPVLLLSGLNSVPIVLLSGLNSVPVLLLSGLNSVPVLLLSGLKRNFTVLLLYPMCISVVLVILVSPSVLYTLLKEILFIDNSHVNIST